MVRHHLRLGGGRRFAYGLRPWWRSPLTLWRALQGSRRTAAGFLVAAGLLCTFAASVWHENRVFDDEGVVTTASVVDAQLGSWSKTFQPKVTVRFFTRSGQLVLGDVTRFAWPDPASGDAVSILYAPRNPSYYVRDAGVGPDPLETQTATGSVLLTLVAEVLLLRPRTLAPAAQVRRPGAQVRRRRYRTYVTAEGQTRTIRRD